MIITHYRGIYFGDNSTQLQEFTIRLVMGLWLLPTYTNLIYQVITSETASKIVIIAIREIYLQIRFPNLVLSESDLSLDILEFDEKPEKLLIIL